VSQEWFFFSILLANLSHTFRYRIETEQLLHNIKKKFDSLVQLNEKSFQNTKVVDIKITKDDNQLHDVVIALFKTKYNPKSVFDFLLKNVFESIIVKPVSIDFNDSDPKFAHLELSYSLKPLAENLHPNYKTVFQNIKTVFQCLGYMNIQLDNDHQSCIFSLFASHIKDKFFNLLLNECLSFSIPETIDEMNESTLIADVQKFNGFLHEMLFLNDDDQQLCEYAEKIEILFRNRFCTNILDNAVDIMRKDLHDMSLMAGGDLTQIKREDGVSEATSSILFSRCMISKSTLELVLLLEKIMKQAGMGGDDISEHLMTTISTILERYIVEVPQYHAKLLTNIPQQTALFHNNCMYLAYWITKNSTKQQIESFATIANSIKQEGRMIFSIFYIDLTFLVSGAKLFAQQMKNQKHQLMEFLYELGEF
jgi:protein transport protein DSL1/ZW10